jgi:hypothetical protein
VFFRVRAEYITLMLVEVIGGLGWSLTNYFLHVKEASTTIEYKAKFLKLLRWDSYPVVSRWY